jgi:hypothetical protein
MRPLATVWDYAGLIDALRIRAEELAVTGETLDWVGGLPDGYTRKLLCKPPVRTLGRISLGALLGALGCRLQLIEDRQQLARVKGRLTRRSRKGPTWSKPHRRKAQGATPQRNGLAPGSEEAGRPPNTGGGRGYTQTAATPRIFDLPNSQSGAL